MPIRDANKSLDERCDNSINITTRKLAQTIKAAKKEKHINGWNLSNKLNRNYVYVRNFPGPKVRSMKDYTKPCIREENPDHIILHVGTNELNSRKMAEFIGELITDLAK